METCEIFNDKVDYSKVRLPASFKPLKYDLDFFVDIKNIKYELLSKIELEVNENNVNMIILNGKEDYHIENISISKYDRISDVYLEEILVDYMYGDNLTQLFNCDLIKKFYTFKENYVNDEYPSQNDLEDLYLNSLDKDYFELNEYQQSSDVIKFTKFIKYFLKNLDSNNEKESISIIEESIYIILPENYSVHDKLLLTFKIKGDVVFSTVKAGGLYFSLFGHDAKLLENETFRSQWNNPNCNSSLLRNAVFTAINEPVDARTYMPCFDEPAFKSKFNVSISIDKEYVQSSQHFRVISNGDLLDIIDDSQEKRFKYKFSESPLMSVYLLTFVIGRFEYLETMVGKTRMRVYTPVGSLSDGTFPMDIALKSLEFYQDYFKIPYSFPKIDLVPVPAMDYRAMENWGCIVYLHYALMAPKFSDIKERKNIARTTAHELSHMWFGNLVTMDWWDDIWLNEGFARFMEFECLNSIKPELDIWSKYIELIYQSAMEIDEKNTTHPVRLQVPSPRNINEIFDTISYAKGASVIRMLSNYVGKHKFRECIMAYMEKYQYKNTITEDLWATFKNTLNIDVKPIMDCWLNFAGHPVILCDLIQYENSWKLSLIQNPFPENFNSFNDITNPLWKIPIFIKTKSEEFTFLMQDKQIFLDLQTDLKISYEEIISNNNFIKVNSDMKGFYRVRYSETSNLLNSLLKNYKLLTNIDISGLLSDYHAYTDILTCLKIINEIKPINDYLIIVYSMKIYNCIKEVVFQYTCFQDILCKHEEIYNLKYKELVNIQDKCKNLFYKLINVDKSLLLKKIYLTDSSHYLNEEQDEFLELVIYISAFIEKDQEVITYIVKNFEKGHPVLHKNLKFVVYSVITNFSHSVLNNHAKEKELYDFMLKEYTDSFYDLSLQSRSSYKSSLINFEDSSDSLVEYFALKQHQDYYMKNLYFKNINIFRNFPNNRKKFLDVYIKILKDKLLLQENGGFIKWEDVLKSEGKNHSIPQTKIIFNEMYDTHLREAVKEYIIEEFKKVDPQADYCEEQFKCIHNLTQSVPNSVYRTYAESVVNMVLNFFNNQEK